MNVIKRTAARSPKTDSHVRLAQRHECHALALIGAASFFDDPHDAYLYPNRKDHPKEYTQMYRHTIEDAMHEELSWVVVAELPRQGIVGYAIWSRETEKERRVLQSLRAAGLKSARSDIPLLSRLAHRIRAADIVESACARWNPLIDSERLDQLWGDFSSQSSIVSSSEPSDYWYLQEVAVAPSHRFQGVGRDLLGWGQHWAAKEGLPILLESTRSGRVLYQRAGFVNYGLWRWGKDGDMAWDLMRWTPPDSACST
ncbi:hypothetical protein BKA66DRAFT_569339 [Pyrenochaeta sp. MPI-SDFR-AT-0127]|nr:hypothetical protein BKA66DRAFT_569339 [Pyrenochaeta sp. MPI-SDFR-AT-0127]